MSEAEKYGDSMLSQAHFEPGETAYHFVAKFTREDLIAAVFKGTLAEPKFLPIRLQLPEPLNCLVEIQVAVKRLDPIYSWDHVRNEVCTPAPDWYVEGELVTASAYGPAGTTVRLYILDGEGNEKYDESFIQHVPKTPDLNGVIETKEAFVH
jgi:hypothetical protein